MHSNARSGATPGRQQKTNNTMEETKLNAADSLALIGRMVENTRDRMAGNAGFHLLIWGYATVITTLAVWVLAGYSDDIRWNYLWFMLPVAGCAMTYLIGPKTDRHRTRTYVDRVIDIIWKVIGFAALLVGSLAVLLIIRIPVTFTILLIIGMGITITSLILRFTPGIAGGTAGIVLGSVSLVITGNWHIALFMTGFVLMLIIPGHMLHYRYKHPVRAVQAKTGEKNSGNDKTT